MVLKQKRATKRRAWNKGLEVGQKRAFTPAQVQKIRRVLIDRGENGLRDMVLFSMAIDTMLQGPDLLNLTVEDVQLSNGAIRPIIEVASKRRKSLIRCVLSKQTAKILGEWIAVFDKKRTDYVFHGYGPRSSRSMSARQMNRLLKFWLAEAGLDPSKYGTESLRRTKPLQVLNSTGDLDAVRALLGHAKVETTTTYLSINRKSDSLKTGRAIDI
jgi:integrase